MLFQETHTNHKIIEIIDDETVKKDNFIIESSKDEFILLLEKTMSLNNSIEKEINEINILYDKTNEEITKSFERRHENLIKKENELKEELQNRVTQIKEKLENFYRNPIKY